MLHFKVFRKKTCSDKSCWEGAGVIHVLLTGVIMTLLYMITYIIISNIAYCINAMYMPVYNV